MNIKGKYLKIVAILLAQALMSLIIISQSITKFADMEGINGYIYSSIVIILFFAAINSINEVLQLSRQETEMEAKSEIIKYLRSQLHDFANHIQVIKGSIQMGNQQLANDYVVLMNKQIKELHEISNFSLPAVSALLFEKASIADQKGIRLLVEINSNFNGLKVSQPDIVRVIGNLINNSIEELEKVNKQNKMIKVLLDKNDVFFVISIWNNYSFIPSEVYSKIFELGYTTKGSNGNGVGLHNVMQLVNNYAGKIKVSSDINTGTMFDIYFPL